MALELNLDLVSLVETRSSMFVEYVGICQFSVSQLQSPPIPSFLPPVQKSSQSGQFGAGTKTPRTSHRSTALAAHSGVKLHPHRKQPHSQLHHPHTTHSQSKVLCPLKTPPPVSQTSDLPLQTQPSVLLSVVQSSSQLSVHQSEADAECDEDFVPVRDINTHSTVTDTHTSPYLHTCTMEMSNMQLGPAQGSEVPQTDGRAETDMKMKTVQYLLGELKALIAGQGKVCPFSHIFTYKEQSTY